MKVLVFGADGQVGHELLRALAPVCEVVASTQDGGLPGGAPVIACDFAVPGQVEDLMQQQRPDAVVNAAAYTAVDRAESDPDLAHRINAEAVAELRRSAETVGARVIHYSTDYVFDGAGQRPYRETDPTGPVSEYGRSKLRGEQALAGSNAVILRLGWVYAIHGRNFARTMLRLALDRDELGVVDDQVGAPTPARWIANVTAHILHAHQDLQGLFHLAPTGHTTWFGYCTHLLDRAHAAGLLARVPTLKPLASHDYPTPASRPGYSCLDSGRLASATGLALPDWRIGVDQFVADMAAAG